MSGGIKYDIYICTYIYISYFIPPLISCGATGLLYWKVKMAIAVYCILKKSGREYFDSFTIKK
jgi:hypothetical protein